ncbi:MAG TPA: peptidoglycan-binding protein [Bacillales bacterium]|nr:peptidoglycan-binding protein [Bacillales bacterium]
MTDTVNMGKKMILSTAAASFALSAPLAVGAATGDSTAKKIKIDTTQILHYGSNGKAVKSLQVQLHQKDYYQDSIDGIYGPHTLGAVTRYQQTHGLAIDGIAGPRTLSSLFTVQGNYVQSERLLTIGDRGQAVRAAQEKLQALGYYNYNVDGIFGPITKDAVKHFQAANDLLIDGIVGPQTHRALFGVNSEEAPDVQTLSVAAPSSTSDATGLVTDAKQLIGSPYQWGGTSPSGFDCSGFINYVFQENGVNVPRSTSSIWNYGIPIDNPQAGDLVFFETYKAGPSHVGIYLGSGRFVHAGSDGVEISQLSLDYWSSRYIGAKRIVQN